MITATQVKELREQTGAGMMECKKALTEAAGDIEAACLILRERGNDIVRKKAARETGEGIIVVAGEDGSSRITFVEVRCETDFVSRNPLFQEKAQVIANAVHENGYFDLAAVVGDSDIKDMVDDIIVTFGENARVVMVKTLEGTQVFSYVHMGDKLAAAVALKGEGVLDEIGHDLAMQVSATDPICVAPEQMPVDAVEVNRCIFEKQAEAEDKPAEIAARIVEGKVNKFMKETALLTQPFVKEPSMSVEQRIAEAGEGIEVEGFIRCEVS